MLGSGLLWGSESGWDGSLEQRDNFEVRWEIIDYETPFCSQQPAVWLLLLWSSCRRDRSGKVIPVKLYIIHKHKSEKTWRQNRSHMQYCNTRVAVAWPFEDSWVLREESCMSGRHDVGCV